MTSPDKIALADELDQLIEQHVELNTFSKNDDGSITIDAAGLVLTLSEALRRPVLPHREALEKIIEETKEYAADAKHNSLGAYDACKKVCAIARKQLLALQSAADTIGRETFLTDNSDGSITLDAYAGKSREEIKQRCRELVSAVADWQFAAMFAATDGSNSIENIREPYRAKIAGMIEAYSDDATPSPSPAQPGAERIVAHADCLDCRCQDNELCAGTQPRASLSPAPLDRDRIARVIDPEAFDLLDRRNFDDITGSDWELIHKQNEDRGIALSKADAIIALLTGEGK